MAFMASVSYGQLAHLGQRDGPATPSLRLISCNSAKAGRLHLGGITNRGAHCPLRATPLQQQQRRRCLQRGAEQRVLAAVKQHVGGLSASGLKFSVVVGRFNDLVTKLLLEGAVEGLKRHGASEDDIDVVWVPGSFEIPVVAKGMAKSGSYNAVITIGAVVRGATTHYDTVCSGAASGVLGASIDSGVPVIFGVLTCDTMEQALDRAGGKVGNKGYEAAVTAVEMANLMCDLQDAGKCAKPW